MRNLRAWYRVPNKKGVPPSLYGFVAGTDIEIGLRVSEKDGLSIQPEREGDSLRWKDLLRQEAEGGISNTYLFILDIDPPKWEMSRFLAKMAVEAYAMRFLSGFDNISFLVDESYLDPIRTFARYGSNVSDWPYHQRRIYPEETLMRHPKTGEWVQAGFGFDLFITKRRETFFAFCLYGVEFVINLGGPSIKGYEEWLSDHQQISPLIERVGVKLTAEGEGKNQKFYLVRTYEVSAGAKFDRDNIPGF